MNHETPFTPPTYFIPLWHPTRKILAIGGQRLIRPMRQRGESGIFSIPYGVCRNE